MTVHRFTGTTVEEYLAQVRARKCMSTKPRPYSKSAVAATRRQLELARERLAALLREAQDALAEADSLIAANRFRDR